MPEDYGHNALRKTTTLAFDLNIRTSDRPAEKNNIRGNRADCPKSCGRGCNIQLFMSHNFDGTFMDALGIGKICVIF
jgi:hypothetical protein